MTSDVSNIFSQFRSIVKSYKLASLAENTANELLGEYISSLIAFPKFWRLFKNISYDSDVEEIEFTMRNPSNDIADEQFVIHALAMGLAWRWADSYYQNDLNMMQMFTNKE